MLALRSLAARLAFNINAKQGAIACPPGPTPLPAAPTGLVHYFVNRGTQNNDSMSPQVQFFNSFVSFAGAVKCAAISLQLHPFIVTEVVWIQSQRDPSICATNLELSSLT